MTGWYYLHVNGELIYKRDLDGTAADIRESDLARGMWPVDETDRAGAWRILIESLAAGAKLERVKELAAKWSCDDADAAVYAQRVGVLLSRDGNMWAATRKDFQNLQESPAGFGETCLEAMAELAKDLGYQPFKTFGAEFAELVTRT